MRYSRQFDCRIFAVLSALRLPGCSLLKHPTNGLHDDDAGCYLQGDLEEKLGIAISPLCDRRKADELPQAQCSFLEYIVLPLATEIRSCLERQVAPQHSGGPMMEPNCTALYLMEGVISHANYNLRCWKSMTSPPSPQRQENTTSFEPLAMAEKDNEAPCHNDRKGTPTVITTD